MKTYVTIFYCLAVLCVKSATTSSTPTTCEAACSAVSAAQATGIQSAIDTAQTTANSLNCGDCSGYNNGNSLVCQGLCTALDFAQMVGLGVDAAQNSVNDNNCTCAGEMARFGMVLILAVARIFW